MLKFLFGALVLAPSLCAAHVSAYAPSEAPYQYLDAQNRPAGFAVDVVRLVLAEARSEGSIDILPWPRIQQMQMTQADHLIFTVYRNAETEAKYQWVGPIVPFKIFVYRLKSRPDVKADTLATLAKYKIGVVTDGSRYLYFRQKGLYPNLDPAANDELNIRKFFAGRIDVLPEDPTMLAHAAKRYGFDPRQAVKMFELAEMAGEGQLAFTLKTPPATVRKFAAALEKVKAGKAYRDLLTAYGL
ncbi:MAG: transporter substrate-binding domain-containing protein [Pseudomonadota bacterium]